MRSPNLLFLYTDEQAHDTLSCYGNSWIEMPNLNALAETSTVFERAYVTQPVCTPSRSTLMTGLWPHTNGCVRNNVPLRVETPCLPELLPEGEHVSGHFGKWHLGDEIFRQHGFDEWRNYEDNYIAYYGPDRDSAQRSEYHHYLVGQGYKPDNAKRNVFGRTFCARLPEEHGKPSWVAGQAIDFIERHAGRPFALCVNFLEPHMPFTGPRDGQYDPASIPMPGNHDALPDDKMPEKYAIKSREHSGMTEAKWRALRARYYGLCSLVDTHASRILDALKAKGLWDDTIIVFTSDHGDMMGSHRMTAKGVMYEEAIRVPMLVKAPGQREGWKVAGAVSHIDFLPTLLDLMGADAPEKLQGRSLRPVMESADARVEDDVFIEWNSASPTGGEPKNPGEEVIERTVVTQDGWKLVLSSCGRHILFDLNDDPGETKNLHGRAEHASRVRDLAARIEEWQKRSGDGAKIATD